MTTTTTTKETTNMDYYLTRGGDVTEYQADNDADAVDTALRILDLEAPVVGDQWDADGWNDDDVACERLLIWDSEEAAANDPGARSVAAIGRIAVD